MLINNVFLPLGGGNEIGASCYFLQLDNTKIIIDAGIRYNSKKLLPSFNILYKLDFLDSLTQLDAVIITHGHLDHCGALPYLFSQARNVPIYATKQTKQIAELLYNDINKEININNSEFDLYLYNRLLIENTLANVRVIKFYDTVKIKNLEISFFPAGHILGAAMIFIKSNEKNVLITGDFSSFDQYTVKKYEVPENLNIDLLITETTYGYQNIDFKSGIECERSDFINMIGNKILKGGTVLIPAFAIGRTQEIALLLNDYFQKNNNIKFPVYIGGLASLACNIYEENGIKIFNNDIKIAPYSLKKLKKSLIIASSGMLLKDTTSYNIACRLIEYEDNMICFSGYLDEESPGNELMKMGKGGLFKNDSKEIKINAEITKYRLSAHTNIEGIFELINKVNPKELIFVHGIPDFSSEINIYSELLKRNKRIIVHQSINELPIYF
ncbi:MAG: MBL fold metallo-hydrolase [Melioribacteraceae bacterium]